MQSLTDKAFVMLKRKSTDLALSSFATPLDSPVHEPIDAAAAASASASASSSPSSDDDSREVQNEDDLLNGDASKQLVLYDPIANGTVESDSTPPAPIQSRPPCSRFTSSKQLPSIGAFTVQCASCFKWRLMPTKEKYEQIREHILEIPFVCERAREWRPDISCDDPEDISQDGSRLWAIDKPNIAQPPPGWQRLLRIRGEGSTKFADIYYQAPSGKRLRSMKEVEKYLNEHPEFAIGVTLSRFSFQIPKPLQEEYVRKRPARLTASNDSSRPLELSAANLLAWSSPNNADFQLGNPALPSSAEASFSDSPNQSSKKARKILSEQTHRSNQTANRHGSKVEKSGQSRHNSYA